MNIAPGAVASVRAEVAASHREDEALRVHDNGLADDARVEISANAGRLLTVRTVNADRT